MLLCAKQLERQQRETERWRERERHQMPSERSAPYRIFSNISLNTSWHCKYFWLQPGTLGKPVLPAQLCCTSSLPRKRERKREETLLQVIHGLTLQIPTYAPLFPFPSTGRNGPFPLYHPVRCSRCKSERERAMRASATQAHVGCVWAAWVKLKTPSSSLSVYRVCVCVHDIL